MYNRKQGTSARSVKRKQRPDMREDRSPSLAASPLASLTEPIGTGVASSRGPKPLRGREADLTLAREMRFWCSLRLLPEAARVGAFPPN